MQNATSVEPVAQQDRSLPWAAVALIALGAVLYAVKVGLLWHDDPLNLPGGGRPAIALSALVVGVGCVLLAVAAIALALARHPAAVLVAGAAILLAVVMTVLAFFLPASQQQTGVVAVLALGYGSRRLPRS